MTARRKATDEQVLAAYAEAGSIWRAAATLNMCGQSVHERLVKLGACQPINTFSDAEKDVLRAQYIEAANAGQLDALAKAMGRTKPFICRQARALGLTDQSRKRGYLKEVSRAAMKAWLAVNAHPRGMFGKKHSEAARAEMSKRQLIRWDAMTEEQRTEALIRQLQGKARKNGGNITAPAENRVAASWKAGWREIGDQRRFFRSRWEANYARYLQYLQDEGKIAEWRHEPQTFWFETITRGSITYLPDFRVVDADGNVTFHEVKGWMDSRSRTKIARMGKYYPEVTLIVVDATQYKALDRMMRFLVTGWE